MLNGRNKIEEYLDSTHGRIVLYSVAWRDSFKVILGCPQIDTMWDSNTC